MGFIHVQSRSQLIYICVLSEILFISWQLFLHSEISILCHLFRYLDSKLKLTLLSLLCSHVWSRRPSDVKNRPPRSSSLASPSATSTNHLRGGGARGLWRRSLRHRLTNQDRSRLSQIKERKTVAVTGRSVRSLKKKIKRTQQFSPSALCNYIHVIFCV